jgi:multimeric flavodoxin WrbA
MKILTINASPKRITCASKYYLDLLNMQMAGCKTEHIKLTGPKVYDDIFSRFDSIDALVIAVPVYVDGVPSGVLRFMQEAEKYIKQNNCRFKLYVITNCGFIEGRQCKNLLSVMQSFSNAAGLEWGGGVGIGGGEMLSVLRITPLFEIFRLLLSVLIFTVQGNLTGGLAGYSWIGFMIYMLVYLVFSSWMFCGIIIYF